MRVFYSNNGTLSDITSKVDTIEESSFEFNGFNYTEDAIFVGLDYPTANLYFDFDTTSTANIVDKMSFQYWSGQSYGFRTFEDKFFALTGKSGWVDLTPNPTYSWQIENTNYNGVTVTGLSSVKVFELYWLKITLSETISTTHLLKYIGKKFCNDYDVKIEFPEFSETQFKTAYTSGRVDFEDVNIRASELVVEDLIKKNIIFSGNQLLDRKLLKTACVQKSAEIIFNSMGPGYVDRKKESKLEYEDRLNKTRYLVDYEARAFKSSSSNIANVGYLSR